MVHVSRTVWRVGNQATNSASCVDNALCLLVLVSGKVYWGFKWRLHFQYGVAFRRVLLGEVYFEGPNHIWRALNTSLLNKWLQPSLPRSNINGGFTLRPPKSRGRGSSWPKVLNWAWPLKVSHCAWPKAPIPIFIGYFQFISLDSRQSFGQPQCEVALIVSLALEPLVVKTTLIHLMYKATKGEFPCRPLVHQKLVWLRINPVKRRGNLVGKGSYVPTSYSHLLTYELTY